MNHLKKKVFIFFSLMLVVVLVIVAFIFQLSPQASEVAQASKCTNLSLSGKVTFTDGTIPQDAVISYSNNSVRVDKKDGSYHFNNLRSGSYSLIINDKASKITETVSVTLNDVDTVKDFKIAKEKGTFSVFGDVYFNVPAQKRLKLIDVSAKVQLLAGDAKTVLREATAPATPANSYRPNGLYRFNELKIGTYWLKATSSKGSSFLYPLVITDASSSVETLDIIIGAPTNQKEFMLTGAVTYNGQPVTEASVIADSPSGSSGVGDVVNGQYTIVPLKSGKYTITGEIILLDGTESPIKLTLTISEKNSNQIIRHNIAKKTENGTPVDEPTVNPDDQSTDRCGVVSGTVTYTNTELPFANAEVVIEGTELIAKTDESGRFTIQRIPVKLFEETPINLIAKSSDLEGRATVTLSSANKFRDESAKLALNAVCKVETLNEVIKRSMENDMLNTVAKGIEADEIVLTDKEALQALLTSLLSGKIPKEKELLRIIEPILTRMVETKARQELATTDQRISKELQQKLAALPISQSGVLVAESKSNDPVIRYTVTTPQLPNLPKSGDVEDIILFIGSVKKPQYRIEVEARWKQAYAKAYAAKDCTDLNLKVDYQAVAGYRYKVSKRGSSSAYIQIKEGQSPTFLVNFSSQF